MFLLNLWIYDENDEKTNPTFKSIAKIAGE